VRVRETGWRIDNKLCLRRVEDAWAVQFWTRRALYGVNWRGNNRRIKSLWLVFGMAFWKKDGTYYNGDCQFHTLNHNEKHH
jgi:hypothetical protein